MGHGCTRNECPSAKGVPTSWTPGERGLPLSFRAVIIGLLLGVSIAGLTYFNDAVVRSSFVIGNQFPIGVFGVLMLLLLGVNPLLGRLGKRWPLRPGELALITALGLAVCGWPGSGFFRYFTTTLALPPKLINANPAWQAAHVMSYVPGGSARLGMGQGDRKSVV